MLFLTTRGAIFEEPDTRTSQGNIIVCSFISFLNLLLPNSNSEFFRLSRRSKTMHPNILMIPQADIPCHKAMRTEAICDQVPFLGFSLIEFLNSESSCLILVMYRTASNRFVSRSSRLLYFLTVSDTFCRSIILFTDQKDDGLFALFFATVRL